MSGKAEARDRSGWPVRRVALRSQPPDNLSGSTTAEERLAMMWPLAVEAWTLAGRVLPGYSRNETPVRVLRGPQVPSR